MSEELFEYTNVAAYFLWEKTKHNNALDVWNCAEDIASYFERNNLLELDFITDIFRKDKNSFEYISFIRNVSFRIYTYTNCCDKIKNWFCAEELLKNNEWIEALVNIAVCFAKKKVDLNFVKSIKAKHVQDYYYPFTQNF